MASVTFWTYPLAFNPAKAKIALEEKGIKYTEKKIDIIGGESMDPWYIKLNPQASAPTLTVGDKIIPESAGIIKWADEQGDGPLGGDKVDRKFVDQWISKVNSWDGNLYAAAWSPAGAALKTSNNHKIKIAEANAKKNPDLADLYKEKIASLNKVNAEPSQKDKVDANKLQLVGLLDEADSRLNSSKYLAGDLYTMADAIFTPVLGRIPQVSQEKELLDPRANVKKYWGELQQRPSYKAAYSAIENPLEGAKTALPSLGNIIKGKVTGY